MTRGRLLLVRMRWKLLKMRPLHRTDGAVTTTATTTGTTAATAPSALNSRILDLHLLLFDAAHTISLRRRGRGKGRARAGGRPFSISHSCWLVTLAFFFLVILLLFVLEGEGGPQFGTHVNVRDNLTPDATS